MFITAVCFIFLIKNIGIDTEAEHLLRPHKFSRVHDFFFHTFLWIVGNSDFVSPRFSMFPEALRSRGNKTLSTSDF